MGMAVVTGGTGLLGHALISELLSNDWTVRALVRDAGTSRLAPGVQCVRGDLLDADSLVPVLSGGDVVFHCAGAVGDSKSSRELHRINVAGTRNLVRAAVSEQVPRVVYASSVAVYGRASGDYPEDTRLGDAGHPYGNSKIEAERELLDARGPDISIVRPSTLYGPGDRHFLPRLVGAIRRGRLRLIDGGEAPVNLVFVSDVARLMRRCAEGAAPGSIYNVTGPDRPTWRELSGRIATELGLARPDRRMSKGAARVAGAAFDLLSSLGVVRDPPLSRFVVGLITNHRTYPVGRAKKDLGFAPDVSLDAGLEPALRELR